MKIAQRSMLNGSKKKHPIPTREATPADGRLGQPALPSSALAGRVPCPHRACIEHWALDILHFRRSWSAGRLNGKWKIKNEKCSMDRRMEEKASDTNS